MLPAATRSFSLRFAETEVNPKAIMLPTEAQLVSLREGKNALHVSDTVWHSKCQEMKFCVASSEEVLLQSPHLGVKTSKLYRKSGMSRVPL